MIRREPIETKVNHERWLVSYADFVTLLFGFFVVMYSVSQVNENKYRVLSSTLEQTFTESIFGEKDGTGETEEESINERDNTEVAKLETLSDELQLALTPLIDDGSIHLSTNEEWVEISLSANVLFTVGDAQVNRNARRLLASVADILAPYSNAIAVAGHTDNIPIRNQQFANNWELSSARAVSVVNLFSFQGVNPERLSAVGYGEYRPVASNETAEGRNSNRRVVLKIGREAVALPDVSLEQYTQQEGIIPRPQITPIVNTESETGSQSTNSQSTRSSINQNTNSASTRNSNLSSDTPPENAVKPVRLRGGGLLFSSDPNLPRNDPPVSEEAN